MQPMKTLCPNKEVCGSCGWSHIPYDKQLEQKLADINGSFKLKELPYTCKEILPSPVTAHYRNRMDFVIDFEGRVGLRQKGKWWRVIDDHHCFLSDERIENIYSVTRDWSKKAGLSYFDRKAHTGLLRYAVVRSTSLGETMLTIVTSKPASADEETALRTALAELVTAANPTTLILSINNTVSDTSVGDQLETIHGPGHIIEEVNGSKYRITPNAFFQTNLYTASILQQTVVDMIGDVSNKTVMDLYCGSGFFAVALAGTAKKTVGVELVPEAIADAKENAKLNDLDIEFFDSATESFDWKTYNPDVVILDPPRSGMHDDALQDVIQAAPDTIVYVSCNYKNFAREMLALEMVYEVVEMKAIDMFPHTPHVELVTLLRKKQIVVCAWTLYTTRMKTNETLQRLFSDQHLASIATISVDGKPHSSTVFYVVDDNMNLYFPTRSKSRKFENIQTNSSVSVDITDEQRMQTIQIQGTAEEIEDPKMTMQLIERLLSASGDQHISLGKWIPPIKQMREGHFAIIKVTPDWMRLGDFSEEAQKSGVNYTQIVQLNKTRANAYLQFWTAFLLGRCLLRGTHHFAVHP